MNIAYDKLICNLSHWTPPIIDELLDTASHILSIAERVDYISSRFLDTPYNSHTLIGSADEEELLVVNLSAMDCFTFLDYVESMRLSAGFPKFVHKLAQVRYKSGAVSYFRRNHFFTDWCVGHSISDFTGVIGKEVVRQESKALNRKADGSLFLPGIPVMQRIVKYIPSQLIDSNLLKNLQTGDYIGIYSEVEGLDVSHVGIFLAKQINPVFRHASSNENRVVDVDFYEYVRNKPGIVILRPY
jgi:hypothetical protein